MNQTMGLILMHKILQWEFTETGVTTLWVVIIFPQFNHDRYFLPSIYFLP